MEGYVGRADCESTSWAVDIATAGLPYSLTTVREAEPEHSGMMEPASRRLYVQTVLEIDSCIKGMEAQPTDIIRSSDQTNNSFFFL